MWLFIAEEGKLGSSKTPSHGEECAKIDIKCAEVESRKHYEYTWIKVKYMYSMSYLDCHWICLEYITD